MNSRFSTIQESFRAAGMPPPRLHGTVTLTETNNHADKLAQLRTALDFCAGGPPDKMVEIQQQSGSQFGFPPLAISWLGMKELLARSEPEKGHNSHQNNPKYSIKALERSLKKGIAPQLRKDSDVFLKNMALTGSARFFELPLKYGLKPDPEKTREMLRATRRTAIEEYKKNIKHYQEIEAQHRKTERNRQAHPELDHAAEHPNLAEELAKSWRPSGIRAFARERLSGMHRMDLLTRAYGHVHAFIAKLKAAAVETRANALIAEEAREKQKTLALPGTARKKVWQKISKAQQRSSEQAEKTDKNFRLAFSPMAPSASSSASGSARVERAEALSALPSRDKNREILQMGISEEGLNPRKNPDKATITPERAVPETSRAIGPERKISEETPANRVPAIRVYVRQKNRQPSVSRITESSEKSPAVKEPSHKGPAGTAVILQHADVHPSRAHASFPPKMLQPHSQSGINSASPDQQASAFFARQKGDLKVLTWWPGSRFHEWVAQLARQASQADRDRVASRETFTPETRRSIREAEQDMQKRWAQAMQEAAMPDNDVVIDSSETS